MFTLPCDGPFGCFDYYGANVICIDETKNLIFHSDVNGKTMEQYQLPAVLNSDNYCWIKIYFINGKLCLGLLKSHADKSFHLVSLRLNLEDKSCTLLKHVQTGISSHGFRVEAHRSMSQIVFSICNTKYVTKKPLRRNCDRQSFMKQLKAANSLEEEKKKEQENGKDVIKEELKAEIVVIEEPIVKKNHNFMESVLLLVKAEGSGDIIPTILSTGRRRYGIKLHKTRSIREFRRTFSTKFMTRWRTFSPVENSCEPFLWGNNACVLSRDDPSFFYLAHTILNAKSGLVASFLHKLSHRFRTHTPVTEPQQSKIRGEGPKAEHVWSNIDIIQGMPTFLTMDPENLKLTKWQIQRDVYLNYDWRKTELEIEGPLDTHKIMFRSNSEHVTSLEFTLRFQLKNSDGKSHFHNISIPRIVLNADSFEF